MRRATPGYEKPALLLYADREGASQCATRQLPDKTAVKQWVVVGDLRMARLPQTLHGFQMWVTVKSGERNLCSFELRDNANWETGGSTLVLKAGDASATLVNDHGVYTAAQPAKTDIFGKSFTSFHPGRRLRQYHSQTGGQSGLRAGDGVAAPHGPGIRLPLRHGRRGIRHRELAILD